VVTTSNWGRFSLLETRVNDLAKQGYRLGLTNNQIAVMYRRSDSVGPVSYVWLETKKKEFEKKLMLLQEKGAVYRMKYPNEDGLENKLIFEQKAEDDDGKRREYKVLKLDFKELEDRDSLKVHTDLSSVGKETLRNFNELVKEGFEVRDLFDLDEISILLERSR